MKTSEGQPRPTQPDPVWGHLVAQYDVRALADQYPTPGALAKVLDGQEALHCTRVWDAWAHKTMTEDDFSMVADDDEALDEIVDAVMEALHD